MKDESIFLVLFFATALASLWLRPDTTAVAPLAVGGNREDRCHDPALETAWGRMVEEARDDPVLLKARALRLGLCQMLEQGEISPEQVAEMWASEPSERAVAPASF